uniref:Monocarboxylate transporter n=1 Tax=Anopheles atroparvus TaxID=41427 RepID=A0A182IWM4_ANOAO
MELTKGVTSHLGGTQCMYRSYPNLPQNSSASLLSSSYRQQQQQQQQQSHQNYPPEQSQPKPPLAPPSLPSAALPASAGQFQQKKSNCYYCNNNINLTCTCLSSSALGYFYSTSQALHSSAPSTLNRRRSSIRNPPSVSFAADSTGVQQTVPHHSFSYSSLPRCRGSAASQQQHHHSRTPSTVAVGVQIPSPPTQPPPVAHASTTTGPTRRSQQHQESQVDEAMLGLVGETKPLGDGSDDPLHDDDDDLDDPIQDSPALSASPPPAPPPLPPPVRNGCQRCRFSQLASANSTLNRSHPHLASGTGTLGSGSIGGGTLTRPHRAGANGGTLERNQHMAASSGHLHTAGGVATTAASAGTGNGTYPGYDRNRLLEEEDSAYPALLERELHSLHRNVPALRRAGVDTTAIRQQHFYPDGGWGWIVCGVAFLAHVLTTGFQLSYGLLLLYAIRHLGHEGCVTLVSLSLLVLSAVADYRGLCFSAWAYGLGLGGYRYTLKMLAIERIRGKYFSKAWGFIKGAESLPVLFGVPLCAFLNDSSHRYGRAGYYICAASAAISAIILFFVGYPDGRNMKYSTNGSITSRCTAPTSSSDCQHILDRSFSSQRYNNPHWYGTSTHTTSLANGCHGSGSYAGPGPVGLQRCLSTSQFMNGGLNLSSAGALGPGTAVSSAGTGVGGAGLSVGGVGGGGVGGHLLGNSQSLDNPSTVAGGFNSYHSAFCGQGSSYHPGGGGRLQKSLSFAFQTPPMFSDEPMHHTCQQASYAADYPPPSRCYSRCEVHNPSSLATPVTVHRDTFGRHHSFRGTTGSSSRGQTPRHTAGRTGGGQGPATPHHHQYHHSQQHQQQQQHHQHHQQLPPYPVNGLQYHPSRSRSVPEGLGGSVRAGAAGGGPGAFTDCHWNHCHWTAADRANFCRPHRPIQVVEQITTSV